MLHNSNLETFIVVSDLLSFSKAAEKLYITPSAVIKQIKSLETEYQMEFFKRSSKGLTITDAGRHFLQYARQLLKDSYEAESKIKTYNDNIIRICRSVHHPTFRLHDLLLKIKEIEPELSYYIIPYDIDFSRRISGTGYSLLGTDYDVAFGNFSPELNAAYPNVETTFLMKTRIRLAMSVFNPLAEKDTLSMEDLQDQTIMLYAYDYYKGVRELKDYLDQKENIFYEITDNPLMELYNICANSNHLSVSSDVWNNIHPLIVTKKVDWPFYFDFSLIYLKNPPEKVRRFVDAAKKAIEKVG